MRTRRSCTPGGDPAAAFAALLAALRTTTAMMTEP